MESAEAEVTESAEAVAVMANKESTDPEATVEVMENKESTGPGLKERVVSAEVATVEARGEKKVMKSLEETMPERTEMVMRVNPEKNTTLMTGRMEPAKPTEVTERVLMAEATTERRLKARMPVLPPLSKVSRHLPLRKVKRRRRRRLPREKRR
jgi:hypothetical protein